jgi:putative molybdopterin biosynthesis protein
MGRRTGADQLENRVRELRQRAGLNQGELAERTGVTRQAIGAIEAGQYVPNTAVALRLARALGCGVEDIFSVGDISRKLHARAVATSRDGGAGIAGDLRRVHLARVGEQIIARPLSTLDGFTPADGVIEAFGAEQDDVTVDLLVEPDLVDRTIVVLGCDPSLGLLAEHVHRQTREHRVLWRHAGSQDALRALRRGEAHIAGTHLWDPATGQSNLPAIRRELAGMPVNVIALSEWQQGLMVQQGNPKGIRGVQDLAREDVSIVNRGPGSGSRVIFDHHLRQAGIDTGQVTGYDRLRGSHAEVAAAVRDGLADAGPGILATARLYGLDFIPLQQERYDLVVPVEFLSYAPVRVVLETATGPHYRREIDTLGGYDPSLAGTTIAEFAP